MCRHVSDMERPAGGTDYRCKCVTLGIHKVQLGRVKCVHVDPLQRDGNGV
jgi:hypothetical protein